MAREYTLILSKGTHLITSQAAATILAAINEDRRIVELELDLFGGGDNARSVHLVIAHVVALSKNVTRTEEELAASAETDNVIALRRRSASSSRLS